MTLQLPRPRTLRATLRAGNRTAYDLTIETAWLVGLFLIPLAFSVNRSLPFYPQPKLFILHLAALVIAVTWAFEWALARRPAQTPRRGPTKQWSYGDIAAWARGSWSRWAILSALAFGILGLVSVLLSPLPWVSVWGRDPNDPGYEVYSLASFLVIFFAIAIRLRTREQAWRLVWALAAAGGIAAAYGISQRFGWDPIGPGAGESRVFASFGNPIFFGSYLVMSTILTAAAALDAVRSRRMWPLGIAAALLALQAAALWFTGSRGPWIGFAAGMLAFIAIGALWVDRRSALLTAGGVAAAGALVAVLSLLPGAGGSQRGLESVTRLIGTELIVDRFTGRFDIWAGTLELARTWQRVENDPAVTKVLRPFFGYGPDMYYYSFPLTVESEYTLGAAGNNPHNYPLHVLMEHGSTGLVAFSALFVLVLLVLIRVLRSHRKGAESQVWMGILAAGVMAALIGRMVEQLAGVARLSDLAPFWALIGLAVALGRIHAAQTSAEPVPAVRSSGRRRPQAADQATPRLATLAVAIAVAVAGVSVFIVKDVQPLRAGTLAMDGYDRLEAGDGTAALRLFREARELAPDVELYHLQVNWLLRNAALRETEREEARRVFQLAYDAAAEYERRDPYAHETQRRLATAALDLYTIGAADRRTEALLRQFNLISLRPLDAATYAQAANVFVALGEFEVGIETAMEAIALEHPRRPQPQAWWVLGEAQARTGLEDEAVASFEAAIERDPEGEYAVDSHRSLATLYEGRGETDRAEAHRAIADALEQALQTSG